MNIWDIFDFIGAVGSQVQFCGMLDLNRNASMQQISSIVQSSAPDALDRYEREFLERSIHLLDDRQKRRAMELYAWLKVCEHIKVGEFRGFPDED